MVAEYAYGWWPSALSANDAARGRISRAQLLTDGRALYWTESRPEEGGRMVLVRAERHREPEELSPPGANLRSAVHEYGGGACCIVSCADDEATFAYVERADQRIWLSVGGSDPSALSAPPPTGERWAHGDLRASADGRHVLAVRERHHGNAVTRSLVALRVDGSGEAVLAHGRDFYAAPALEPGGERLAYVCWDHPAMSWDRSELWVVDVDVERARVGEATRVVGGTASSVGQPQWGTDGALVFAWDAEGWWQPWQWAGDGSLQRICAEEVEFHAPDWVLGQRTIVELANGDLCARVTSEGRDAIAVVTRATGAVRMVDQPAVAIDALCPFAGGVAWRGRTDDSPSALFWADVTQSPAALEARVSTRADDATSDAVSRSAPFDVRSVDGAAVGGLLYLPTSAARGPSPATPPPLVVWCHGGPTGMGEAGYDVIIQFFTSRGLAVAVVNYRGSSGYGRAYRERLQGQWGIVDADDCVAAARGLAERGLVDGRAMAIRGTSAGGFSALNALVRADLFAGACVWYPVTDLLTLQASTHDFESHYNDWLVGPLPEAADEYRRRSPLHRVDDMSGEVMIFQGLDDPVVPPEQSASMIAALRGRGIPCDLATFEGEGHGFRRAETIEACLEAELAFYRHLFSPLLGGSPGRL